MYLGKGKEDDMADFEAGPKDDTVWQETVQRCAFHTLKRPVVLLVIR